MEGASPSSPFRRDSVAVDPERESARIAGAIREQVANVLRRRGVVIGLSGGVDSSVTAALCVRALGERRVLGLMMPDRDSETDSVRLGRLLADRLGIETIEEDIDPVLEALGCFDRRDRAVRMVVPDYASPDSFKVVIARGAEPPAYTFFRIEVQSKDGRRRTARLSADAHLEIVAATNFKQRTRKMLEYHHADRLHYAVVGTPNRLEYDQGFFVKNGDGAADLKPIAHLYKTQVYQLAQWLGIPDEIRNRPPTTDTYPMRQSQEEFYFSIPLGQFDLCLWGVDHGVPAEEVADASGLSVDEVRSVWADIAGKRRATRYLHLGALLVEPVLADERAGAERDERGATE